MCFSGGGGGPAPAPTVDPEAERRAAEAQAVAAANQKLAAETRRKRVQKGLVVQSSEDLAAGSVLAQGQQKPSARNVLGGGGG